MKHASFRINPLAWSILTAVAISGTVQAQTTSQEGVEEVVVTGFRASLDSALNQKRENTAAIDSIVSEDIGKFPDSNLAESMQRIPGVTLARGDGGEGKSISVRGLGAGFTRVRINGMEGAAQTGSSDIHVLTNSSRGFHFNVFPSEIFSNLTVRKTPSANVEEGSLGATVDISAPRPLALKDEFTATGTLRGSWNEVSEKTDPRMSGLIAKKFADDTFGVLLSVAHSERNIREVGYSAVNLLPGYVNGGFCTPAGYSGTQTPVNNPVKGTDELNCATGNPRTSDPAAYAKWESLTGISGNPGGGVFMPRIPRYINSVQDAERTGGSLTLEWQPSERTNIALDGIFSRYDVVRYDNYINMLSLARGNGDNGQPMMSIKELEVDPNGSLVYGRFDGVDLRAESLRDSFTTTFQQLSLDFSHQLSDTFEISGLIGHSDSEYSNPERLTVNLDTIDVNDVAIDNRGGGNIPILSYGNFDVSNPNNFQYAARGANGDMLGAWNMPNSKNITESTTAGVDFAWQATDIFNIKFGLQHRINDVKTSSKGILQPFNLAQNLPAGTSVSDFTRIVQGVNNKLGSRTIGNFVGVDHDKWKKAVGFDNFEWCTSVDCNVGKTQVKETINSVYLMTDFRFEDLALPVRGDIGVRYVETDQYAQGNKSVANPAGSTYPTRAEAVVVERTYDDLLPSANVVVEINESLLARFSYAEVMSRPELGHLTPGVATINPVIRQGNFNNPYINAIRAKTYDASLEWYFDEGSLLSVAYFEKDISTYIQSTARLVPFSELGLPDSLLEDTNQSTSELYTMTGLTNTPGGPLRGVEVNLQMPFHFLPGFWKDFGLLANYTNVTSEIDYVLRIANGAPVYASNDLIGLSKDSAGATLYYEKDNFSIRTTGNYRSPFLLRVPAEGNDSDVQGTKSTFYVDASASYNLTDNVTLIVEAQNLTDERNTMFMDSTRQDTLIETRTGRTLTLGVTARF